MNYTLEQMIDMTDKRKPSFQMMIDHLKTVKDPLIVETGCIRPGDQPWSTLENSFKDDGMSTCIFDAFVMQHGGEFHSVDLSPLHVEYAQTMISDQSEIHCRDSVEFLWELNKVLKQENRHIHLLYLDSYDWVIGREPECMAHHIKELASIVNQIASGGLVAVDDNYGTPDNRQGKGVYVHEFMQSIGAPLIYDGVQCIWKLS
jgi:hypothetical protein